ncbi:GNAT family N-acetyltransferase [Gynuella sunshinyii]|uniref:Acetyltransferase n=1 Tax=Gynuella sunshinyii YC6258 TaxID=1445510 RepID=A0A0C5VQ94_9GAMM|nr:GNAT family N-acetyltransferase [Gynuella sunshinyii]AJQ95603.1 acetyltransferase [Gynuella sunshinyii YC6258]
MNIVVADIKDAKIIADIISQSNEDVAIKFGINKDNNPKHPSFCDEKWVLSDFDRGEKYFLYQLNGENVGCVAFEQPTDDVGYLNRLSVLPSFRKQGIGKQLTQHVLRHGESKGVTRISIGIIAKHTKLKEWYTKIGFVENGLKKFPHLPFDVLFMKYELKNR